MDLSQVSLAKEKVEAIVSELKKRYPPGSALPSSFEELKFRNADLSLSTLNKWTVLAFGMKAREFLAQEGLLKTKVTTFSIDEPIDKDTVIARKKGAGETPYALGKEPPALRCRLDCFFEKLDEAYPDKVIVGLNKDHKHWAETATALYRELGYETSEDFFMAYGYSVVKHTGGRPKMDHMAVVEELKRRYANGPVCATMLELKEANPDLAHLFKNLMNQANTLFGMTLVKFFVQENILVEKCQKTTNRVKTTQNEKPIASGVCEFDTLKSRYIETPFSGTLSELQAANEDLDWDAIYGYYVRARSSYRFDGFLSEQGIMAGDQSVSMRIEHKSKKTVPMSKESWSKPSDPSYYVEEVGISEKKAEDGETVEYRSNHLGETLIEDFCNQIAEDLYPDFDYLWYMMRTKDALLNGTRHCFDGMWSVCIPYKFERNPKNEDKETIFSAGLILGEEESHLLTIEVFDFAVDESAYSFGKLIDEAGNLNYATASAREYAYDILNAIGIELWSIFWDDNPCKGIIQQTDEMVIAHMSGDTGATYDGLACILYGKKSYLVRIEFQYHDYLRKNDANGYVLDFDNGKLDSPAVELILHFYKQFFNQLRFGNSEQMLS